MSSEILIIQVQHLSCIVIGTEAHMPLQKVESRDPPLWLIFDGLADAGGAQAGRLYPGIPDRY